MNMTHKQFAQLLRQFADMVENRAIAAVAEAETPTSTNNIGELIKEAIDDSVNHLPADGTPPKVETPSADQLKALLQTVSRKYSSPEVRDTISNTIGDFKTANKMTDAERKAVHVALLAEYDV